MGCEALGDVQGQKQAAKHVQRSRYHPHPGAVKKAQIHQGHPLPAHNRSSLARLSVARLTHRPPLCARHENKTSSITLRIFCTRPTPVCDCWRIVFTLCSLTLSLKKSNSENQSTDSSSYGSLFASSPYCSQRNTREDR